MCSEAKNKTKQKGELLSRHYEIYPSATTVRCELIQRQFSQKRFITFTRLDRIRDEIAELGDVAVSMETDVVNRQQVKKSN